MTPNQQSSFEAFGFLEIPDALGQAECTSLVKSLEGAAEESRLNELPNVSDMFIRLAEHSSVFPCLHRIIGDNIQLRAVRSSYEGKGHSEWNCEAAALQGIHHATSTLLVQTYFILADCSEDSSPLHIVPGSHRFRDDLPIPDVQAIQEMPNSHRLAVSAGTAVIVHGNLWQALAQPGVGASWLRYDYVHCWMRHALPELTSHAEEIANSSHNLSQLFGTKISDREPAGYWGREVEGFQKWRGLPERKFAELEVVGRAPIPNRRLFEER